MSRSPFPSAWLACCLALAACSLPPEPNQAALGVASPSAQAPASPSPRPFLTGADCFPAFKLDEASGRFDFTPAAGKRFTIEVQGEPTASYALQGNTFTLLGPGFAMLFLKEVGGEGILFSASVTRQDPALRDHQVLRVEYNFNRSELFGSESNLSMPMRVFARAEDFNLWWQKGRGPNALPVPDRPGRSYLVLPFGGYPMDLDLDSLKALAIQNRSLILGCNSLRRSDVGIPLAVIDYALVLSIPNTSPSFDRFALMTEQGMVQGGSSPGEPGFVSAKEEGTASGP